mmetsp:Transcript_73840/g.228095  ORF Transcript_73840/g.228095 Transcript_73840/m.228095 type:complete len:271 (+) Transcript_73840:156-968(+)
MIYLFKWLEQAWYAPSKACGLFERLSRRLRCAPAAACCAAAGGAFANFMNRPLSSYVVIVTLLAAGELRCCICALSEPSIAQCRSLGLRRWLLVKAGFACLNMFFAPYFQCRVWEELLKDAGLAGSSPPRSLRLSKAQVQASTSRVFMRDHAVCFYFIASLASFVWGYLGFRWTVLGQDCEGHGHPLSAFWLGSLGFAASLQYGVFALREDCSVCGEDGGSEWGRCEPRPQLSRRRPEKPAPGRPWLEPPRPVLMNAWDVGAARRAELAV